MGEEISLYLEDLVSPPSIPQCRICHEEEGESSKSLEAPCSCSGTLKFAHRECIQRWCDEKGNTTCEICLQNFEAGYMIRKKARLADIAVTIRESLEVPRQNHELHHARLMAIVAAEDEIIETRYPECSSASERSASCCRSLAIIFTILLLARHLVSILVDGTDHYAFTLLTVLVLRASGIIVPLYIMVRTVEKIQWWKRQYQQHHVADDSSPEEAEEVEQLQHTVQIH